jgi:hypothetical protein
MEKRPGPQGTIRLGETSIEITFPARLFLQDTPRPDGYQPIANNLWGWQRRWTPGLRFNELPAETFRFLWNIARRLDVAHRQFELVREGLAHADRLETEDPSGCRRRMFEVLGDTELAVIALSRALQLTRLIPSRFPSLRLPFPDIVKRRTPAVYELRRNCEHLEVDELQRPLVDADHQLIAVFRAHPLFEERRVVGLEHSLDIDTDLVDVITTLTVQPLPRPSS